MRFSHITVVAALVLLVSTVWGVARDPHKHVEKCAEYVGNDDIHDACLEENKQNF
jgi:hypothetical protein